MYRKEQTENLIHHNIMFDDGGVGDCVARLPAVEFILQEHPQVKIHLWVPDYFLDFATRSLSSGPIIRGFSEHKKFKKEFLSRTFTSHRISNLAMHMTDHAFAALCGRSVENEYKNYLPLRMNDVKIEKFELPKRYVVVCTGYTTNVRRFLSQHVNAVARYLLSRDIVPVFLGKYQASNGVGHVIEGHFDEDIDYDDGIDLIDKTSLVECAKVISQAAAIVGLDNGLLHIAGTTTVPIVGGFTTVHPKDRMPYRNGILGFNYFPVVPQNLECRFCQSNLNFTYNHRFIDCYYKDFKCVKELTADQYIEQLEKCL